MIVQPSWAKDAVPTPRGWASPKGELLKLSKEVVAIDDLS